MAPPIATSLRRARPSDTAALTELVNRAFAVERWFIDGQRTTSDEIAGLIASGTFLVLECAGGIAAAVRVESSSQRGQRDAYLGMLSVAPELQRMGLGRRLVGVAEAVAEAAGAAAMTLRIINLREDLSRWYKGLGYREIGTIPFAHASLKRPCHFIEMAKSLVCADVSYQVGEVGAA